MAESTMVESLREDGLELVNDVVQGNVPVAAAWLVKVIPEDDRMGEREEWQFFLASPLVDQEGPQAAYQKIYDALRSSPRGDPVLARISLGMIKVVGVNDKVTADVFKIVKQFRGAPPIYVARCRLGGIEVRDLHIFYVLRLPPPWQQVVLETDVQVQPSQEMQQAIASGHIPIPAQWPIAPFPAGSVVNAKVFGSEPDPMLLIVSPDGRQRGFTYKSKTKPEGQTVSP